MSIAYRGTNVCVGALFPPSGFQRSNLCGQPWWQGTLAGPLCCNGINLLNVKK